MQYRAEDLIQIFKQLFRTQYNTELVSGSTEPLYRVKRRTDLYHQIIFAHGFFSSALHEIAHWCVAGPERRQQDDYGYWYAPDGRNQVQQTEFFQAERKPQALEWIFSTAAGYRFQFSADNLGAEIDGLPDFKLAVQQQVHD